MVCDTHTHVIMLLPAIIHLIINFTRIEENLLNTCNTRFHYIEPDQTFVIEEHI